MSLDASRFEFLYFEMRDLRFGLGSPALDHGIEVALAVLGPVILERDVVHALTPALADFGQGLRVGDGRLVVATVDSDRGDENVDVPAARFIEVEAVA